MKRPRFRLPALTRIVAVMAIVTGGAIAFALPAGADISTVSPAVGGVQVGSPAVLEARGAAVTVPITYFCTPGSPFAGLSVEVVQRVGGQEIARGSAFVQLPPCTGDFQNIGVTVLAQNQAFRKGEAFASASLTVCDYTGCRTLTDQKEIRIVR
jgi:hypothetical protein